MLWKSPGEHSFDAENAKMQVEDRDHSEVTLNPSPDPGRRYANDECQW